MPSLRERERGREGERKRNDSRSARNDDRCDAYFFVSRRRESRPDERTGPRKQEQETAGAIDLARRPARADGSILIDNGNRIVDAEKLVRYFALPIRFPLSSGTSFPGRRASD